MTSEEELKKAEFKSILFKKLELKEFTFRLRDKLNDKYTGTRHAIKIADAKEIVNLAINKSYKAGQLSSQEKCLKIIEELKVVGFEPEDKLDEFHMKGWNDALEELTKKIKCEERE